MRHFLGNDLCQPGKKFCPVVNLRNLFKGRKILI